MSGLILCRTKESTEPFYIESAGISVYSLEELSYYIYHNIYLIEMDFINDDLLRFIREGVGEYALADRIDYMLSHKEGLAQIIVTILNYVDYYNDEEITQLKDILETLNTQNTHERFRSRADSFLKNENYYKAIATYAKIIEGQADVSLPGAFYADVHHNMGVAYARMFLYEQAADCFAEAYRIGQREVSKKAQLHAKRLAAGQEQIEKTDANHTEEVLQQEYHHAVDNARYQDIYRNIQVTAQKKDAGQVAQYYTDIDALLDIWKQNYRKYTS